MVSDRVIQNVGGWFLMIAGFICAIVLCFHPDEFVPGSVLDHAWVPVHLSLLVAFTLSVFGVTGVYNYLRNDNIGQNEITYVIAMLGSIWSVGLVVIEGFVLPGIASVSEKQVPLMQMMANGTSLEHLQPFFLLAILTWIFGWLLVGISLLKSNKTQKYIGMLVIVGAICVSIPTHFAGGLAAPLHILFSIIFGLSWILLGNRMRN
jgi:hypothetical protein